MGNELTGELARLIGAIPGLEHTRFAAQERLRVLLAALAEDLDQIAGENAINNASLSRAHNTFEVVLAVSTELFKMGRDADSERIFDLAPKLLSSDLSVIKRIARELRSLIEDVLRTLPKHKSSASSSLGLANDEFERGESPTQLLALEEFYDEWCRVMVPAEGGESAEITLCRAGKLGADLFASGFAPLADRLASHLKLHSSSIKVPIRDAIVRLQNNPFGERSWYTLGLSQDRHEAGEQVLFLGACIAAPTKWHRATNFPRDVRTWSAELVYPLHDSGQTYTGWRLLHQPIGWAIEFARAALGRNRRAKRGGPKSFLPDVRKFDQSIEDKLGNRLTAREVAERWNKHPTKGRRKITAKTVQNARSKYPDG